MKTEDYKKSKEELQSEIVKNAKIIAISDERTRMANVNQFEFKGMMTLAFSLIPYLGLGILTAILVKNGNIAPLVIPGDAFPYIIIGGALCIGTIGRKLLEWKSKSKERLKSFTNASTQSEKLEEEVKYSIELEKAKNRNNAIQQTIDSLNSNQSILNSLSSRYDINDRIESKSSEDAQKKVEELSTLLESKTNELDILSAQKVLHEKFWRIRTKWQKGLDATMASMMGGLIAMAYVEIPFIIMDSLSHSIVSSIFAPLIVGMVGTGAYMVKRNRDNQKVFNILNSELGENALPDKIEEAYEEQQDIDAKISTKTREISIAGAQLQEQKRILELFIDNEDQKQQTIEQSVTKDISFETSYTKADNELQKDEKSASLVLNRKHFNPNGNK